MEIFNRLDRYVLRALGLALGKQHVPQVPLRGGDSDRIVCRLGREHRPVRRGQALPGAAEALRAISARPDLIQSVLTGNTRPSSEIKLRTFGLDGYLDMDSGAYGTDDDTRANLVGIARQRAARTHGTVFDASTTVLIGDTPNDVQAAFDGGARIIAVASGKDRPEDLMAVGAPIVCRDLTDTATLVQAIYGHRGGRPA